MVLDRIGTFFACVVLVAVLWLWVGCVDGLTTPTRCYLSGHDLVIEFHAGYGSLGGIVLVDNTSSALQYGASKDISSTIDMNSLSSDYVSISGRNYRVLLASLDGSHFPALASRSTARWSALDSQGAVRKVSFEGLPDDLVQVLRSEEVAAIVFVGEEKSLGGLHYAYSIPVVESD